MFPPHRKFLIGPNGATISALTDGSRCLINIPGKKQLRNLAAMVLIQISCIEFLLRGCWEVSDIIASSVSSSHEREQGGFNTTIGSGISAEENTNAPGKIMEMKYMLDIGGSKFQGNRVNCDGLFLVGTSHDVEGGGSIRILYSNGTR